MDKSFFTILFLPSNPSKVKKIILSDFLIKSLAVSALVLLLATTVIFFDYVNVKKKEIDLTSLKEQTKVQNVQLQNFSNKINDMEAELARLRNLDKEIRLLSNFEKLKPKSKPKNERISLGGMGGVEQVPLSFKRETSLKEMMDKLDRLNSEAKIQKSRLHELHASLQEQRAFLAATPSNWPVRGYVSSTFGERVSPFDGSQELHDGIDIVAPSGTSVSASADGVVTHAGPYFDLGKAVIIDHGYGFATKYGHLSQIAVSVGKSVKAGQKIGIVGSTGRSTGPHLHFEVAVNGSKVDPMRYLN